MNEYVHPAEREAERIRVIIETLAATSPDMTMFTAAPTIFEIEKRTAAMEAVQNVPATPAGPGYYTGAIFALPDTSPETAARFVSLCPPITHLLPHAKINAIKELRARTGLGLKEAKDGIEHYEKFGAGSAPVSARPASSSSFPTGALALADWIEHHAAASKIRFILSDKATSHYKILAIKEFRMVTSLSLKDSKDAVEEWIRIYDI